MKRAVGYIRRSTDKQEQSLEDQQKSIEEYAQDNSFELIRSYKDDAISGVFTNSRLGFKEMLDVAINGYRDFDYILVWDIKRFSRGDSDEAGHYRHILRQNGVEVVYISENFKGDDSDDLVLGTKQWLARQESKDKSKDTIRGQLSRILRGVSGSGHPYAYYRQVINKDGKVIQVCKRGEKSRAVNDEYTKLIPGDSYEIKIVRRIFNCYVNKGMGYRLIARMLNKEGIPSPRNKKWRFAAIEYILSNQIYIGNLVYNRTSGGKFHKIVKTERGYEAEYKGKITKVKSRRNKDRSQWIVIEGVYEPIISKALFNKAQKVKQDRTSNRSFSGGATTSNYLWSGLIKCKHCGWSMCGCQVKTKNVKRPYYRCEGCIVDGKRKKSIISATQLDNVLVNRIKERFFNSDRINNVLKEIEHKLSKQSKDAVLTAEDISRGILDIDRRINALLDTIDPRHSDLINEKLDDLKREKERLVIEKERLSTTNLDFDSDKLLEKILSYANDFDKVLQQGSPSEKKEIVRSYVGQITIDSDIKQAKVGFYPLPKTLVTEAAICGYAMDVEPLSR